MAASDAPAPYAVEYSAYVLQRLREMAREANARGDGPTFTAALMEFDRRLRLYPQFGDPQIDLKTEPGLICTGTIRPLSMRNGVYEGRRLVLVVAPPILLPLVYPDSPADE